MAAQGAGVSPSFVFFFPLSLNSLAVPRGLHVPDCLPTPGSPVQGRALSANERQCAPRVGACAWEARLPLGGGGGRLPFEPPGLQVESEDLWLWLAVGLSPSPGGAAETAPALRLPRLAELQLSLPHQLLPPLIRSAVPATTPGGWRMLVTCPELPSPVGLAGLAGAEVLLAF